MLIKEYKFCHFCKKSSERIGEGYIILSKKNNIEVTKPCPRCSGTGYLFVRDYDVTTSETIDEK